MRVQVRLTLLCGGVALLAAGLAYLVPWAGAGLALTATAGLGLGWLVAGRTLRPIRQITAAVGRIDECGLHKRVPVAGPRDEVRELAETVNDMLARVDRACTDQQRFVADAVREMRVPLATNRDLLETALRRPDAPPQLSQLGTALLAVTDQQERLVDELLTLVRSEHAVAEPVPVELADIAYKVSDGLEPQARRAGIELRVAAGPARTPGDPVLLEHLAQSLLQNAVQYNTADGWVRVATGTDGNQVRLTVANTGPVVPSGDVPDLFEPFRRLSGRTGAGLGLSIVRSVARAHGGQVRAAPRDGGGLVVEVTLPRSVS